MDLEIVDNMPALVASRLANYRCCLGELGHEFVCAYSYGAKPGRLDEIRRQMKAVHGAIMALRGYPLEEGQTCKCTSDETACGVMTLADHFCKKCGCVKLSSPPAPCTSFSCQSFFFDNASSPYSYLLTDADTYIFFSGLQSSLGFWVHPTAYSRTMHIAGSVDVGSNTGWYLTWTDQNRIRFTMGNDAAAGTRTIVETDAALPNPINGFPWIFIGLMIGSNLGGTGTQIYINGQPVAVTITDNSAVGFGTTDGVTIGNVLSKLGDENGFVGHIDEVFGYSVTNIGDAGFLAAYNNGTPGNLATLLPGFPIIEMWLRADGDTTGAAGVNDYGFAPRTASLIGTGSISDERP